MYVCMYKLLGYRGVVLVSQTNPILTKTFSYLSKRYGIQFRENEIRSEGASHSLTFLNFRVTFLVGYYRRTGGALHWHHRGQRSSPVQA